MLNLKVELGLDLGDNSPVGFTLNEATKGVLNSSSYVLGGSYFYDITNRVQSVSISRGKNQALGKIDSSTATITLNNNDREFDPLYEAGTYFGALVPRKEIRITANGFPVYFGYIDDIDLNYSQNVATAQFSCIDGFSVLANARLEDFSPIQELSSARVSDILDLPEVSWSSDLRNISTGDIEVRADSVDTGTVALDYLQVINSTESGNLFIGKDGSLVFQNRGFQPFTPDTYITDDLTIEGEVKLPLGDVEVIYGSELLYNRIVLSNNTDEVIVEDTFLQEIYGVRSLNLTGLLSVDSAALTSLGNLLLEFYKSPRYRFESATVNLDKLTDTQLEAALELEIGDIIQVHFTPSRVPPAIQQSARIIGISQSWGVQKKSMTFALETIGAGAGGVLTLDSPTLGLLDSNVLG
jgi:hypothetical protein